MAKGKKTKKYKEYQINTIEDFVNIANEKNIHMLTADFYNMVLQWIKIRKKHPELKFKSFKWIDDGKVELSNVEILGKGNV